MKHISSERKTNIINRYYNGDPVAELTEATGIARSTIYGWLKADRESAKKPVTKKTVNDLTFRRGLEWENWNGCMESIISIISATR